MKSPEWNHNSTTEGKYCASFKKRSFSGIAVILNFPAIIRMKAGAAQVNLAGMPPIGQFVFVSGLFINKCRPKSEVN